MLVLKKKTLYFLLVACLSLLLSGCDSPYFVQEYKSCSTHIETTTFELVSVTDEFVVNGNVSGGGFLLWRISGSYSETPIFRFYYKTSDGGIKLGELDGFSPTIYYIKDGEKPYLEKTISTPCSEARIYQDGSEEHSLGETTVTYKLYVPDGSIKEIFEFEGS